MWHNIFQIIIVNNFIFIRCILDQFLLPHVFPDSSHISNQSLCSFSLTLENKQANKQTLPKTYKKHICTQTCTVPLQLHKNTKSAIIILKKKYKQRI